MKNHEKLETSDNAAGGKQPECVSKQFRSPESKRDPEWAYHASIEELKTEGELHVIILHTEMHTIPRWARIAFCVRCVHRVRDIIGHKWPGELFDPVLAYAAKSAALGEPAELPEMENLNSYAADLRDDAKVMRLATKMVCTLAESVALTPEKNSPMDRHALLTSSISSLCPAICSLS